MAVTLTGSGGLFVILGKLFFAQSAQHTGQVDVETQSNEIVTALEPLTDSLAIDEIMGGSGARVIAWVDDAGAAATLKGIGERCIIKMVDDDAPLKQRNLAAAMLELIDQMEGAGGEGNPDDDVDASVAAATPAAVAGNTADTAVVASVIDGNGRNVEQAYAETILATVSTTTNGGRLLFSGAVAVREKLSSAWPGGSGISTSVSAVRAADGLLNNGGFDDEDDRANTPDDWTIITGTIGTTIKMSNYEEQTLVIASSPTSGTYTVTVTINSNVYYTSPLAYNATTAALQAALRQIPGLESVTTSATGTTPNWTHTIIFKGLHPPENLGVITASNTFDVGTITPNASVNADATVLRDKALFIVGDGAELTTIQQRIAGMEARSVYVLNLWMKVDTTLPAAGLITVRLADGAGTTINDAQGTANSFTIDPKSAGDLSTSAWTPISAFFRTPAIVPAVVYLEIKVSTAITNTRIIAIDEVYFGLASQLYAGGPYVGVFAGNTDPAPEDTWTVTVTNSRAGLFQEWFWRNGYLAAGQLLPSDSGAGETIADTLIA